MSSTIQNQSTPIQSDSYKLPAVKKFQLKYESIDSLQKAAGAKSIEEYEEAYAQANKKFAELSAVVSGNDVKADSIAEGEPDMLAQAFDEAEKAIDNLNKEIDNLNKDEDFIKAYTNAKNNRQSLEKKTKEASGTEKDPTPKSSPKPEPDSEDKESFFDKIIEAFEDIEKKIEETNEAVSEITAIGKQMDDHLSGHVSIDDMIKAAKDFDEGYDKAIREVVKVFTGSTDTTGLENWTKEHVSQTIYDACSKIKNGAAESLEKVKELMTLKDTFGGSWRDPQEAVNKLQEGLKTIQNVSELAKESEYLNKLADGLDFAEIKIKEVDTAINDTAALCKTIDKQLSGHVSLKDVQNVFNTLDDGYDKLISNLSKIVTGDESTDYIAAWAKSTFGEDKFGIASEVKNGASKALEGVGELMTLEDTFGGSWRDPEQAVKKIQKGIETIKSGTKKIAEVANSVFKAATGRESEIVNSLNLSNSSSLAAVNTLSGAVAAGIGSFDAFKSGDIKAGIAGVTATVATAKAAYDTFTGKVSNAFQNNSGGGSSLIRDKDQIAAKAASKVAANISEKVPESPVSAMSASIGNGEFGNKAMEPATMARTATAAAATGTIASKTKIAGSAGAAVQSVDSHNSDLVANIEVILEGSSSSRSSCCTINGKEYRLSGYSLSQELLQPMMLSFSIEKEDKLETNADVVFADSTSLIGKSLEIKASTIKTSDEDDNAVPKPSFTFSGMIINVSSSRATASTQSASLTVASWASLMQGAPRCRTFENKTLKDIVSEVVKPYSEIKPQISPRFNEKIPYVVQYNRSDYDFITMLAVRFGEWMYSTGEKFIFGKIEDHGSSADLEYPGGSLMSYGLTQSIRPFAFSHILPNHYKFGSEKAFMKESASGLADSKSNTWTNLAYAASQNRYKTDQLIALAAGGFDDGKESEGNDTILDYSLKIEALGQKTGLMTVHGFSKLAMLKIGQTFKIRDGVKNDSITKSDLNQDELMVIGINHSFDYSQEYSNSFTAVPISCEYPSYSDAEVHPTAPTQRAKVVENEDPQKLGRIRVQFPWQEAQGKDMKTPWLRIAVPYAGASKGLQFVPEIGEEVMVGFEMNNAERPYIIGAFYNGGSGKPDEDWAVSKKEKGTVNNIKAIRTRNGHTIMFNDRGDAGVLEIYDDKDNTYHITLSADDKKITVYSAGQIEVVADSDINVTSKGDIGVKADGKIGIKAKGNIDIASDANISMNAKKEVSIQASKVKVR